MARWLNNVSDRWEARYGRQSALVGYIMGGAFGLLLYRLLACSAAPASSHPGSMLLV